MRTTLDVDEKLLARVIALTGEKSKSKVVNEALREYLRKKAVEGLRAMAGKIDLVDNLEELKELELEKQRKLWEMGW